MRLKRVMDLRWDSPTAPYRQNGGLYPNSDSHSSSQAAVFRTVQF